MNTINEDYTREANKKKLMAETTLLWQYQKLILACSHFDDLTGLDARSFFITLNIKDGKQTELRKLTYFAVLKAFCGNTYVRGSYRPALIIEDDIGGTKWGKGRNENHHFHAVLVLPLPQDRYAMIENDIEYKLVCLFEEIPGVLDAHVVQYHFGDSLAGVMKYAAKLVDRPALDPTNGLREFCGGVYPWEFDQGAKTGAKYAKEMRLRRVAELLATFKADASAYFTSEYMHHFGEEITRITPHFSSAWAEQYPELWQNVTYARKRSKQGLRLNESGGVVVETFRVAA
jgi:hypothetical protein